MKQITILGATDLLGKKLVQKAIAQGIKVKVLVENKEEIQEFSHLIEIVEGSYLNKNVLEKSLEKSQIVLSTIQPNLNQKPSSKDEDNYIKSLVFIIKKMMASDQNRFISISNAGAKGTNEHLPLARKLLRVKLMALSKSIINIRDRELHLLEYSDLDWTVIRLPIIKEKVEGEFVADENKFAGTLVDSNQLSDFMFAEISNKNWIKKAPVVGTK
ncbi:NAD(P)H-binding [Lutibacter oricola]|uniref:NAD(P)H-binding n=1 Tax=Lutibacter oricola TaxID=762486 RepID=A0A1H2WV15_9FLAO|nr:NAD(P)H-binding protein [Lutibacter oricola]SDW84346.1 NAD(P)H-binding [Lutibacter oricola]